jgi:hypothetical protein
MNITMSGEGGQKRTLTTADLAASANAANTREVGTDREVLPEVAPERTRAAPPTRQESLAPLFPEALAGEFRARWNIVQQGFVDDPKNAVRQGDELVAQVIKSLAETFSTQRAAVEGEKDSTEELRLALRSYRSFFERLLSI